MRKLAVTVMALSLACAASINPSANVTYDRTSNTALDSLALLPVTAGEGLEGFRRQTADSLTSALKASRPNLTIISDDTSLDRLNDAGLAGEYASMLEDYRSTGVLDGETLKKMGEAVGASYLLSVRVSYAESSETGYSALTGVTTVRNQDVALFAHLWSPERGDVVWEASAGAEVSAGEFETTRELPEIIGAACGVLADRFP